VQVSTSHPLPSPLFNRPAVSGEHPVGEKALTGIETDQNDVANEPEQAPLSRQKTDDVVALSPDQLAELRLLKIRDREIRAHEQAHASVGGPYAGAPNYQYTKGPDGRQYASSGHVNIDSSKIAGDPEATLQKALQLKRAALAPAQPSQQDRRVAANAQQLATEARADLSALLRESQRANTTAASGATIDTFV